MLYQKILMGSEPYFLAVGEAFAFEMHRHPEIELSYCMEGELDMICEGGRCTLRAGDLAVIPPMMAHEIPLQRRACKKMTIEVGYVLLGAFFEVFTSQVTDCRICRKSELCDNNIYPELVALLEETAELYSSDPPFGKLMIKGNLYRMSALLLRLCSPSQEQAAGLKRLADIKKIDLALGKIYNSYCEPLSIEAVSAYCGYSKSNFCRIFKQITGDTFHSTLNRHRVEVACLLLHKTDDTIEKVAEETGFADVKSFCRTFKRYTGMCAGTYRNRLKAR